MNPTSKKASSPSLSDFERNWAVPSQKVPVTIYWDIVIFDFMELKGSWYEVVWG
jgi:hypothetical protein